MAKKKQSEDDRGAVSIKESRMASDRFYIAPLGEPYYDILKVEAWLKRRTMSAEANSILCARLMQREDYRRRLVEECARKRGIPFQQMWDDIIYDRARPMTAQEYAAQKDRPEPEQEISEP